MNIKDSRISVIVIDTDIIRATFGLQEYLTRPTVTLKACYAVPTSSESQAEGEGNGNSRSGWLVGEELAKALKEGVEGMEVRWPFRSSKAVDDWEGRDFILSHVCTLLNIKTSSNTSPLLLVPPSSPAGLPLSTQALYTQLAFESLNVPGFSLLPSPLASLFALNATTGIVLHVGKESCEAVVVTDSVIRWETATTIEVGIADCEAWLEELLMEDENLDGQLRELAGEGKGETSEWRASPRRRELVREVTRVVFDECAGDDVDIVPAGGAKTVAAVIAEEDDGFDVAKKLIGETPAQQAASHKSKKQMAAIQAAASKAAADAATKAAADAATAAATDIIVFSIPSFPDKEINLGPVRHRLAEPLFVGVKGGDTVWEGMGRAMESEGLSTTERVAVWEAVAVTGEMAKFKSFAPALLTYIAPLLLSSTEIPSDIQPAKARLLTIPDYFTNFKGVTNDEAPFLGASMVAKVAFTEYAGKHYVTKVDYNAKGPAAIYTTMGEN